MEDLDHKLLQRYENLLLRAQKIKIPEREATFFDFAIRKHHENPTTELLSFFLDPNEVHNLNDSFYQGLISCLREIHPDIEFGHLQDLAIEQVTLDNKRIDLWVETETALIIFEVKIDHKQNNPEKSYTSWAKEKNKHSKKQIFKFVLNLDAKSEFKGWDAISFEMLAKHIRKFLGKNLLNHPLNKWGVLAREFLIHLENYYEIMETDMNIINFVMNNYYDIQKLMELREKGHNEIRDHILTQLHSHFENINFKATTDQRDRKKCKTWRFSASNVQSNSDIVLSLYYDQKTVAEVWLCFDTEGRETNISGKITSKLKKSKDKFNEYIAWAKSDEDTRDVENYRSVCWEFQEFDLKTITSVIIEVQKILNEFDG